MFSCVLFVCFCNGFCLFLFIFVYYYFFMFVFFSFFFFFFVCVCVLCVCFFFWGGGIFFLLNPVLANLNYSLVVIYYIYPI